MFRILNAWMFDNVGKKLKRFIRWFVYFSFVAVLILGVDLIWLAIQRANAGDTRAIYVAAMIPFAMVLACFLVWLGAAVLYGFAELVDTAITNRQGGAEGIPEDLFIPDDIDEEEMYEDEANAENDEMWICPNCDGEVSFSRDAQVWQCDRCGKKFQVTGFGWAKKLKEV